MQTSNLALKTLSAHPKFLKKTNEIYIPSETKLNEQIKMNPRAVTKFSIGPFLTIFSWNIFGGLAAPKPKKMKRLKRIASILQQEKLTSSLIYVLEPESASEMAFAISKLKHLQHVSSLNLKILPLNFCTPYFLKSLSITLSHLKNLKSLSISFPMRIEMTPQLLTSLFFALERLNSLKSLSFLANYPGSWSDESWIALTSCLCRLPWLKSFAVTITNCQVIGDSVLSLFAPAFKKLTLLENVNIGLFDCQRVQSQSIINFFTSIKSLKFLKSIALNLGRTNIAMASSDPFSKGLNALNPSLLESLDLKYYSSPNDQSLQELGTTLQRFTSLRDLGLDFKENNNITDQGLSQLASSLETLQSLSSLSLDFFSAQNLQTSVKIIGNTIKHLAKLTSLDLNFTEQKTTNNSQLSSLAAGLQGLTALKSLNLRFSDFTKVTDPGFVVFSQALQGLTELSSLKLELLYMRELTNKGIISLSSAIGNLTKLTYLSLSLIGNRNFNKESTDSLGQAFKNLSSLTSIHLNFTECQSLKGDGDNFLAIFKALGQLKYLRKILASLPFSPVNVTASQLYTRQVTDQTTFWG